MEKKQIVSNKQVKLEIELFQNNTINREVYENVQDELLKEINKEIEKV